ncbi:hypothetical protein ACFX2A_026574 [Malus domestica]
MTNSLASLCLNSLIIVVPDHFPAVCLKETALPSLLFQSDVTSGGAMDVEQELPRRKDRTFHLVEVSGPDLHLLELA